MTPVLVLLVAADGLTRRLAVSGLAMYGLEVAAVPDGEAALSVLTSRRVGVLVANADLGGTITGPMVARAAREMRRDLPVIYTARLPHTIPAKAKVAGAPVLRTPYHTQQLAGLIHDLLHRSDRASLGRDVA